MWDTELWQKPGALISEIEAEESRDINAANDSTEGRHPHELPIGKYQQLVRKLDFPRGSRR